jgi:hypothetical protein
MSRGTSYSSLFIDRTTVIFLESDSGGGAGGAAADSGTSPVKRSLAVTLA